ncbi:Coenzyme F390 synthetase-like protein [Verrucomicrobia bacterium]|nr:Coenzyme F390 synthetase-like protein [Verrucomicrobiota bacterium]
MSRNLLQSRWEHLSESVVRKLQAEQLQRYLRTAVLPFSAYYGKLFQEQGLKGESFCRLEDLQRIPFTSKSDLLSTAERPERFKEFILVPDPGVLARRPATILRALVHGRQRVKQDFEAEFRPIFATFTTGRSAEPIPCFFTARDLDRLATAGRRLVEVCAARPGDRLLNTLPFAPHLAFWLAHYAGTAGGVLTLSSGGGKVMGTEGNIRHIRKFKPDVLIGIPTFVYHLLHQAAEEGARCENLRRIVLGGEKVSDGLRLKLRELALELGARNVDIVATYGFTEAKLAWSECPAPHGEPSSGYHLYPDLGIMEVIDPRTGETLPSGRPGELVFTPLEARGTVVLRYRTGDYADGGLTYEPCPYCGRRLPRLLGNISRRSEIKQVDFDKIKGTLVDFNELEHLLDDAPHIGAWQVELRKINDDPLELDELILHVQKVNGADEGQLRRELTERCARHIEIHPNRILFHNADEIRRLQGVGRLLKEEKLVDHRPKAHAVERQDNSRPVTVNGNGCVESNLEKQL